MTLYAALAGAGVAVALGGLFMVVVGASRRPVPPLFRTRLTRVRAGGDRRRARERVGRVAVAVVAGLVVWVVSSWPVAGLLTAGGVLGLPFFFGAARIAQQRIERLEALEEWTRLMAASMGAGSAPVQTIVNSVRYAPAAIRPAVTRLASRLDTPRLDPKVALRDFAAELDDHAADMVKIALEISVSAQSGQKVPEVLRILADQVSAEVRGRRKIEMERAAPRNEARLLVIIQIVFVAGVVTFTSYADGYGTATGQLVLAALAGVVVLALWMLRRLGMGDQPPRLLTDTEGAS